MSEESELRLWRHITETEYALQNAMEELCMAINTRNIEKAVLEAHMVLGIIAGLTEVLESLLRRK